MCDMSQMIVDGDTADMTAHRTQRKGSVHFCALSKYLTSRSAKFGILNGVNMAICDTLVQIKRTLNAWSSLTSGNCNCHVIRGPTVEVSIH